MESPVRTPLANTNPSSDNFDCFGTYDFGCPTPQPENQPVHRHQSNAPRRPYRPNPLFIKSQDARDRRRELFLNKLKTHREEKILQARGGEDEMMRIIYLAERRRWESNYERAAATIATNLHGFPDEHDGDDDCYSFTDESIVDAMTDADDRELQALVEQLESLSAEPQLKIDAHNQTLYPRCKSCMSDELLLTQLETQCLNCGFTTDDG